MPILRKAHNKQNPYVMINRNSIQNKGLTFQARGLLSYLLSLPEDWSISVKHLITQSPAEKTTIYSILKELEGFRYIKRKTIRNEKKQIEKIEYLIYETPFAIEEKPLPEKLEAALLDPANQPLHNNKKEKGDIDRKESTKKDVAPQPAHISFSFKLNKFTGITEEQLTKWKEAFPNIDIALEIEKATEWVANLPARNKKRRGWIAWFNKVWFPRASEALKYKSNGKTQAKANKLIYDRLESIYRRYKDWCEHSNDPLVLNKGLMVLTETHFYDSKNSDYKYNLDYDKFITLLKEKYGYTYGI